MAVASSQGSRRLIRCATEAASAQRVKSAISIVSATGDAKGLNSRVSFVTPFVGGRGLVMGLKASIWWEISPARKAYAKVSKVKFTRST